MVLGDYSPLSLALAASCGCDRQGVSGIRASNWPRPAFLPPNSPEPTCWAGVGQGRQTGPVHGPGLFQDEILLYSVASDSKGLGPWLSKPTHPGGGEGEDRLLIHTFLGPLISWPGKKGSSRMITLFLILGSGPKKSDLKNIEALGGKRGARSRQSVTDHEILLGAESLLNYAFF